MGCGDYSWGIYRGYCRDPFPHSLLCTREFNAYIIPIGSTVVPF